MENKQFECFELEMIMIVFSSSSRHDCKLTKESIEIKVIRIFPNGDIKLNRLQAINTNRNSYVKRDCTQFDPINITHIRVIIEQ